MKIIKNIINYSEHKNSAVTIGSFDGIHLGHEKILKKLKKEAIKDNLLSVILTFDPHPRTILKNEKSIKSINLIEEKKDILKKFKIDIVVIHPFSKSFSKLSSLEFTRDILVKKFKIKKLILGFNHSFGKNREATLKDINKFSKELNFQLIEVKAKKLNNLNISSTLIRNYILNGEIKKANLNLGRSFSFSGIVVRGFGLGKKLNFPTANIKIENNKKIFPESGVFFVHAIIKKKQYFGMMNIGNRPTLNRKKKSIEIHFFDLNMDLYGEKIEVFLNFKIRDEIKFSSLKELQKQIIIDKEKCINYLSNL